MKRRHLRRLVSRGPQDAILRQTADDLRKLIRDGLRGFDFARYLPSLWGYYQNGNSPRAYPIILRQMTGSGALQKLESELKEVGIRVNLLMLNLEFTNDGGVRKKGRYDPNSDTLFLNVSAAGADWDWFFENPVAVFDRMSRTFVHEATHMLDFKRTKGSGWKEKGEDAPHSKDPDEYANNSWETNARVQSALAELERDMHEEFEDGWRGGNLKWDLYPLLLPPTESQIERWIRKHFDGPASVRWNEDTRRRVVKRLYEAGGEFKDDLRDEFRRRMQRNPGVVADEGTYDLWEPEPDEPADALAWWDWFLAKHGN